LAGGYSKGWRIQRDGNGYIVHNGKYPGLTHLLEHGHVIKNQYGEYGRAPAIVHIKPVEDEEAQKYYDDFAFAYTQTTMLGDMEYFKVLRCDGATADVYYVGKGRTAADVLTFEKRNGNWAETSWETVWSTTGSASEVIYPYWWHFIYGGF
jgi:hypothetical protein